MSTKTPLMHTQWTMNSEHSCFWKQAVSLLISLSHVTLNVPTLFARTEEFFTINFELDKLVECHVKKQHQKTTFFG